MPQRALPPQLSACSHAARDAFKTARLTSFRLQMYHFLLERLHGACFFLPRMAFFLPKGGSAPPHGWRGASRDSPQLMRIGHLCRHGKEYGLTQVSDLVWGRPERPKALLTRFNAFALSGRNPMEIHYPGRCPGLGAAALSGRTCLNPKLELMRAIGKSMEATDSNCCPRPKKGRPTSCILALLPCCNSMVQR